MQTLFNPRQLVADNPRDAGRNAYIMGAPEYPNPYARNPRATLHAARLWHMGWLLEQADDVGRRV